MEYFSVITTCKQYQVIRFFSVKSRHKAGEPADYSILEVVQRWIAPDGRTATIARLRGMSFIYYDQWAEGSDMEVRRDERQQAYDISPVCTYPRKRFIPELTRNGFKGECHGIQSPAVRQPSRDTDEGRAILHAAILSAHQFPYR